MEFYKLNHEANITDLETFNYPNQKIGVLVHIEDELGNICFNKEE